MSLLPMPFIFLLSAGAIAAEPARDRFGDPLPTGAVQRLSGLNLRHPSTAFDLAFSPDGKILATACAKGNIYLWDPTKGKKIRTLSAECPGGISALRWMHGGKTLCAAGRDGVLHILDVAGNTPQRRLGSERVPLTGLDVSDDGKTFLTVNQQGRVRVWDAGGDKPRREYAGLPGASLIALTPDGTHTIYIEPGGALRLVEISSGKEVRTFTAAVPPSGPRNPKRPRVAKMTLSRDGKQLAYSDWRNQIHVHALKSGEQIQRIDQRSGGISDLAFAPGGQLLAVASAFGVHLYGIASGRELRVLEAMPLSMIHLAFSPNGKTLAGLAPDSGLHLWDVPAGHERFAPEGHGSAISDLLFLPDGRRLVSHGADGQLCLWDLRSERMLAECRGRKAYPRSLIASEDGLAVRLVGLNQGIESWDLGRDPNQRTTVVVIPRPDCAAVSPDGKSLALATHDHQLQLRQSERSTPRTLDSATKPWHALRFSPDNRLVIGANADGSLRLWDRVTGEVVRQLREPGAAEVRWLEFAADGRSILVFDGALRVVEAATGQERIAVQIKTANVGKAYSPNGRWAACAAPDGSIRVYALGDGDEIAHFQGARGSVNALAFSPDGRLLVSAGADRAILAWKLPAVEATEWKAAETAGLWDDLRSKDGQRAHQAMARFGGAAEQAVPFLHELLRTQLKTVDARRIAQLVQDLDADAFARREKASSELAEIGEVAMTALNKALEGEPSTEMRRRVRDLLNRIRRGGRSAESLRGLRAIEVLERIGTRQARQTLADLGGKDIDPALREEIRASLRRLDRHGAAADEAGQ